MKTFILSVLFLFLIKIHLFAEKPVNVDSLQKLLPILKEKNLVDALNDLSWELKYENLDLSIKYNDQSFEQLRTLNYDFGRSLAFKNKCAIMILQGKFNESEKYGIEALKLSRKVKDNYQQAKILNLLALVNKTQAKYLQSIEYQNSSLKLFREIGDSVEIAGGLNNLATVYEYMGNKAKGLEVLLQVLDIESNTSNFLGVMRTANNIGNLYQRLQDSEKALKYYHIAVDAYNYCKNEKFLAAAFHGIGECYLTLKNYKESEEFYKKAIEINKSKNYIDFLAINYLNLGNLYNELGKDDKALELYTLAMMLDIKNNNIISCLHDEFAIINIYGKTKNYSLALKELDKIKNRIDSLDILDFNTQFYYNSYYNNKMMGNYATAIDQFEKYVYYKNEIDQLEDSNNIKEVEAKYDVKTYEQKNALLIAKSNLQQQKIFRQKMTTYGFIMLSIIILAFALFIFKSRRNLKFVNSQLEIKNKEVEQKALELKEANAAKDKFFSIIAHDLKNPFGAIMNLSNLVNETFDDYSREELKSYMKEISKSSLSSYDLLVNLLDWSRSQMGVFKPVIVTIELAPIIQSVIGKNNLQMETKNIELSFISPEKTFVFADTNMLEIILGNLVSNAIKFTPKGGKIEIYHSHSDDKVQLFVKDSGVGISSENIQKLFRIDKNYSTIGTESERGTGLGLILCKELIEKMNGSISLESEVGKGSTFSIQLPKA